MKKLAGYQERGFHIFLADRFIWMVADAAGAAEKEHGGGQAAGHHDGVVACAAGHGFCRESAGFNCVGEEGGKALVHGHGRLFELAGAGEREAAFCGDFLGFGEKFFHGCIADSVAGVPDIEAYAGDAGNYVADIWFDTDAAYCGGEAFRALS